MARNYRCGGCGHVIAQSALRRDARGDVCCPTCGSQDVTAKRSLLQRFGTYLFVSNFY